jgi:hypothetical protein
MDQEKIADQMLELFHEHCRQWAVAQDGEDWSFEEAKKNHYTDRVIEVFDSTVVTGNYIVVVRQGTNDELHYFDLVGMVEEGDGIQPDQLAYLTACIDTSWADVWRAEYPTGLIDPSKPWIRQGKFLSLPEIEG